MGVGVGDGLGTRLGLGLSATSGAGLCCVVVALLAKLGAFEPDEPFPAALRISRKPIHAVVRMPFVRGVHFDRTIRTMTVTGKNRMAIVITSQRGTSGI